MNRMNLVEVHARAGTPAAFKKGALNVIVVHEAKHGGEEGCGALGHLNPHHAEHAVGELWAGLETRGVNPKYYFGMTQPELLSMVKSLEIPREATAQAEKLVEAAKQGGFAAIAGVYSHERAFSRGGIAPSPQKV